MLSFVIDVLVLFTLAFFAWNGFRKGFFLSLATLVIFFVSIMIGTAVANQNVETASVAFDSILDWVAESATQEAIDKIGQNPGDLTDAQLTVVIKDSFASMGIRPSASTYLASEVKTMMKSVEASTLYESISQVFIRALAWIILFFAGFVITNLLLSLIANFVATIFKLPVLKQLDSIGGIAMGFINGLLLMFSLGLALRYFGILFPQELLNKTVFLRFFIEVNPFGGMMSL